MQGSLSSFVQKPTSWQRFLLIQDRHIRELCFNGGREGTDDIVRMIEVNDASDIYQRINASWKNISDGKRTPSRPKKGT